MLYLNYAALENGKTYHALLIISLITNNIPTMSHYSWTKESRTMDKKLNGKKTSEIKNFIMKEMSSNPQKLKKQLFTRRMIFDLFHKSKA